MHVNRNMVQPVLDGIAEGELTVGHPDGDMIYNTYCAIIDDNIPLLVPRGDRVSPVGAFLPAKRIAYAQGFIAAYRSAEL